MKTRYVKRLTRSLLTHLNSPQSHRFFSSTTTTKCPLRRHQTTLISTRPTYSPPKFLQITTFATKNESIFDAADELREDDNKHDVASERKEPLHEFSRNVVVLTCESKAEGGQCVVYLVGTAHVSQASCREVEAVIRHVKPQVVFLELCASRVGLLTIRNLKVPTMKEMIEKWKKTQNAPQIFLSWFYATAGDKLGVVPGSEFQVAFEEARKCEAKVVLGDRPAQITFRRTQGKLPFWHKVKFLCAVFVQTLFSSSSKSIDTMIKDLDDVKKVTISTKKLSKQYPTVMETLVDERDQYMSSILLRIAKEHTSVVAVIGKGHLQGIKKYWEQPIELKDLLELPPQKPPFSALKVLAVAGRKELPEELSRSVMVLTCESKAEGGTCVVHLVGTAHVSQESCREVQAVVSYLKPQVVFLELCASRVALLTPQNLKVPTMGEMIEMWKKNHNTFGILYSWFLAKVSDKLEVFPGSEFRVAFEEARKYEGKVVLGDRPVQITLQRTWGKMPLWHKVKLLYSLLFQALFLPSSEDLDKMLKEMDDVDMLTLVIQEMSKQFPTLMDTLVHERDQYMSSTLLRIAKEHTSVVAVVGKGHLQGIKKHWGQPFELKDLMEIPSQKPAVSARKVLASLGVAVAGVAIVSGFYLSRKK